MSAAESFQKAVQLRGVSLSTFLVSLSTSVAIFGAQVLFFFLIRTKFPELYVYSSRPSRTLRKAITVFVHYRWEEGVNLDMYFLRRYFRTLVLLFLPPCLVITPVLSTLNFLDGKGSKTHVGGLDRLGWSNVGFNHTDRYWAHLVLALQLVAYVCWIVWKETHVYVKIRHLSKASALRTVLIDSIPTAWLSEETLRDKLDCFGKILSISFNQDSGSVRRQLRERDRLTRLLEKAETSLIRSKIANMGQKHTWELRIPFLQDHRYIEKYRTKLLAINNEIDRLATVMPTLPSAFITFDTPRAASMACQSVIHCEAAYMTPKTLPASPQDIIWDNVSMPWWHRVIRGLVCNTVIVLLALVCAIPISISSLLSQAIYLSRIEHLRWLQRLPEWALGVLQGLLPPLCLAILLRAFSSALVFLITQQGIPLKSLSSLRTQDCYFFFLLIQVTISVSLSAGITAFTAEVASGTKVATTLAQNLPKASNYFLSYVILQALSISAGALLRLDRLIETTIIGPLLDDTVSAMLERVVTPAIEWGTFIPTYTNLACIGLLYAIISPIIIPFELLIFVLSWIVHIRDIPRFHKNDQGGLFYPKALRHLLVGVYTMEISLLSLFLLVRDDQGQVTCIGQAILSLIAIAFTALYHSILRKTYGPLLSYYPTSTVAGPDESYPTFPGAFPHNRAAELRLPRDGFGFSNLELKDCYKLSPGVGLSSRDAQIDEHGKIRLDSKSS